MKNTPPPLPPYIKVACYKYELIEWKNQEAYAAGRYGECSFTENVIRVDCTLKPTRVIETIMHEVQHAINDAYRADHKKDSEEERTRRNGVAWAQVWIDNPWLRIWLDKMIEYDANLLPEPVI